MEAKRKAILARSLASAATAAGLVFASWSIPANIDAGSPVPQEENGDPTRRLSGGQGDLDEGLQTATPLIPQHNGRSRLRKR